VILLEYAAQGIRGVAPVGGRATLRPGYNVVAADGVVLRRLLEALLWPDPRDGDALPRAPGGPAGAPVRAGLTLVGSDGVTYRLVRDFSRGAQLHRFDAASRSFALVSQELSRIAEVLLGPVGVPPAARFGALLVLSASELPSRQLGAGLPGGASVAATRASLTPEQAKKRIADLRGELERARRVEKVQVQLDALQARALELDRALKDGTRIREGLEKAESERRELEGASRIAAQLGPDPEARIAAYAKAAGRREEALARVTAEREALAATESRGSPLSLLRAAQFWYGVVAGMLLLAAGVAGAAAGSEVRYLALLDIPAFGWSAWVALRWIGRLEEWERLGRRRRALDEWEGKVVVQLDHDTAEVRAAMQELGFSGADELKETLARVADADAVVAEWRRRLGEWEANPEASRVRAEQKKVGAEIAELEKRLAGDIGGFVRDVRSIEQAIQRLENEAANPAPPPAPVAPARPATPSVEPLRGLLQRTAGELGGSPAAAARAVSHKASQALSGLTFQRLSAIAVDDRGNLQVTSAGRPIPALSLPPADRDLVFVALRLAFLEQALAEGRSLALVDDALAPLTDGAKRFAARLMKQIARPGQLVHATGDAAFREAADHVA
jgi:hypothetical protein